MVQSKIQSLAFVGHQTEKWSVLWLIKALYGGFNAHSETCAEESASPRRWLLSHWSPSDSPPEDHILTSHSSAKIQTKPYSPVSLCVYWGFEGFQALKWTTSFHQNIQKIKIFMCIKFVSIHQFKTLHKQPEWKHWELEKSGIYYNNINLCVCVCVFSCCGHINLFTVTCGDSPHF